MEGFDLNYLVMDIVGYAFYGIYSSLGFFMHEKGAGTVVINDLIFVYHALFIMVIEVIQVARYPRGKNRINKYTIILCVVLWLIVIVEILITKVHLL